MSELGTRLPVPRRAVLSVVAGDKLARAASRVKLREAFAAAARTVNVGVFFAGLAKVKMDRPMLHPVGTLRLHDLKVLRAIVRLVAVDVMRDFALHQRAAQLLLGYQPMLVNVAAHVRQMMARHPQENVTVRTDRSAAAPVRVARTRMNNTHSNLPIYSITHQDVEGRLN